MSTRKTSIFDFYGPDGPNTLQRKINNTITGDGSEMLQNRNKEETAELVNAMFGVPKVTGAKKKARKK